MIGPVSGLRLISEMSSLEGVTSPFPTHKTESPDFAQWLDREFSTLNTQLSEADQEVRKLALGESGNLHHVMLSLEKAKMSFELLVQVRNRLVEGYQELMRMQV
jgi:flagellar hook-basal body complex protein FliE